MNAEEMRKRTQLLAIRIIRMTERLPKTQTAEIIGKQLIRCGTSVGANYRAALRARSRPDFLYKLGIVEEEADETIYWLEVLIGAEVVKRERLADVIAEVNQILAIVVASIKTVKRNKSQPEAGEED